MDYMYIYTIMYLLYMYMYYVWIPRKCPWDTRRHHGTDGTGQVLWITCTYILLSIYFTCTCTVYGSLGSVHGIPDNTMALMGRDGTDTVDYILLSIYYTCICTVYGSLGSVHGIPDDTMVLMGRDGHCGLQT